MKNTSSLYEKFNLCFFFLEEKHVIILFVEQE